jgi:hypothetical protein
MAEEQTKASEIVDSGRDTMGWWEIWNGEPPLARQRERNPLMSKLKEGEYAGCYLLEWFS